MGGVVMKKVEAMWGDCWLSWGRTNGSSRAQIALEVEKLIAINRAGLIRGGHESVDEDGCRQKRKITDNIITSCLLLRPGLSRF